MHRVDAMGAAHKRVLREIVMCEDREVRNISWEPQSNETAKENRKARDLCSNDIFRVIFQIQGDSVQQKA